jgi:predicted lipoprotein with Yx(FWY)xxD motif
MSMNILRRFTLPLVAAVAVTGVVLAVPAIAQHGTASRARVAAAPAKLQVHKGKLGRYVVDGKGFTLYLFEKDAHGKSACYASCAKVWAPLLTSGKPTAGSGVKTSKIGTVKRKNGTTQVTYGGHPLYHYDDDHKPGMTEGQGSREFGAKWYVVAPSGNKIDNG